MKNQLQTLLFLFIAFSCTRQSQNTIEIPSKIQFYAVKEEGTINVFNEGQQLAVVTQQAKPDHRPFIHPLLAPDSKAELTQYSPGHHKHQTGLYWGFTRVNGTDMEPDSLKKWFYNKDKPDRIKKQTGLDYFHHPEGGYWKRLSLDLLESEGERIKWKTVYHMMNEEGEPILKETQTWVFEESDGRYLMSLEWDGEALIDITINEFAYGGMFLRMPWNKEIIGEVVNAARQRNQKAEGQRAMWVDVGMEI